jgi:rRNA biogenesis protein RRP5
LLTQKALRYEDFTVGEVVEAKIDSLTPAGVSVDLGVNLKGFIPKLQWADDPRLKKPELRFRVGEPITCRVLKVMIDRKTVHLTCKKSMLDEAVVAYCYPSQLKKHLALKGTVVLIEKGGVVVSFFGELTGYRPVSNCLVSSLAKSRATSRLVRTMAGDSRNLQQAWLDCNSTLSCLHVF